MNARSFPRGRRAGGWSLVELAVVLAVMGLLGVALWQVLPLGKRLQDTDTAQRDLAQGEQALIGYALAHHRFPAPAIRHGQQVLPVGELGLPSYMVLRYEVQPALTTPASNQFSPLLPPTTSGVPTVSSVVNGLDLCMRLKTAGTGTLIGMQGVPTAFALMHTETAGTDRPSDAGFVLPGTPGVGGRAVLAVGPGELASRIACPDRVARVHGSARAAYAAYDLARLAVDYRKFRTFAIQVAEMNKKNADTGVAFASFDLVYGVCIEAIAILQEAAGWPPDALGIATGIASHVEATAQIAIAIYNVVAAAEDLEDAKDDLAVARQQETAAYANETRMQALAAATLARALALDRAGLQP
jgi:type II secretory pathway pseudopilin PulG